MYPFIVSSKNPARYQPVQSNDIRGSSSTTGGNTNNRNIGSTGGGSGRGITTHQYAPTGDLHCYPCDPSYIPLSGEKYISDSSNTTTTGTMNVIDRNGISTIYNNGIQKGFNSTHTSTNGDLEMGKLSSSSSTLPSPLPPLQLRHLLPTIRHSASMPLRQLHNHVGDDTVSSGGGTVWYCYCYCMV